MKRITHGVRVARQMADDPGVIHAIARCRALCVILFIEDLHRVVVANLENGFTEFRVAIALRLRESVVIDFRLRMMMRRIAGPTALKCYDFAEYQLGISGCIAAIEYCANVSKATVIDLALASRLVCDVLRAVDACLEFPCVVATTTR